MRVRRPISLGSKITAAVSSTVATVYLALVGIKAVPGIEWLEIASIGIDAAISLGVSGRAIYFEAIGPKHQRRSTAVRQALEAAWAAVSHATNVRFEELMVSAFFVERESFRTTPYLKRYMRVGVKQIPQSTVRWEKGKGAVGACWRDEATTRVNLSRLNYTHGSCAEDEWEALGPAKMMGMSFAEWRKTRRKYDMIIAVPIHRNDEFVGCVALTGPTDNTTWLQAPEVEQALVAAAATIAQTG